MSNSKAPDNPLEDVELREKIGDLVDYYAEPFTIEIDRVELIDEVMQLFTSEADKRVEAVLDRLQPEDWEGDNTQLNLTRNDFYQTVEAERQRLNKEQS